MHKIFVALACLSGFSGIAQATVVIDIDAGYLSYLKNGVVTPLPAGSLLQLIASPVSTQTPDGAFPAPTSSSFVTGSDILVASFGMNNTNGTGETGNTVQITLGTGAGQVPAGDALLLRWFNGTTYSNTTNYITAMPTAGSTFGQYRSDTTESNEKGLTWFVPNADGSTFTQPTGLDFQTVTVGGSNPDVTGEAITAIVPEPSVHGWFIGGLLALTVMKVWHRRKGLSSIV